MRKLETFDEVVSVLGGMRAVAELCGRSRNAVTNWRRELSERFPARFYRTITDALVERNAYADDRVWAWAITKRQSREATAFVQG